MHDASFLEQKRRSPAGLGIVVTLHAAALTALILAPPEVVEKKFKTLIAYPVPDTKPPEPVPPEQKPAEGAAESRIRKVEREVPVTAAEPVDVVIVNDPVVPPLDDRPAARPEPIRQPVLAEAVVDPRYADAFQPPYPPAMARQEVDGRVVVRVLIGTDGRVRAVELVSATDAAFFEATRRQALRAWRFKPATRDGVPVETWRTMTVRFEMQA